MFKISPVNDEALSEKYLTLCGAKKVDDAFLYAMTDIDTEDIMGICQFEILSDFGYIYDLKPKIGTDDFEAMFILGRQTMNFIDICGNHICKAKDDAGDARLLRAIGFKESNGELYCDMTGMFDGHCSGHPVDLEKK